METLDTSPEETATSETTAASGSDKAEETIKPKTLPISISVSHSKTESITVSGVKPELHSDNKSEVKSELDTSSDSDSSSELIVPTDLMSASASDSKPSDEPRLEHVSERVLIKVSSPKPLEMSTEIKQDTPDSVTEFETTQIYKESIAVSTESMKVESGLETEIMTISNSAFEPKVVSESDDAISKLTPTFDSVLQFQSTDVVEQQDTVSASDTASNETVQPESTPEFDVKATSQFVFEPIVVCGSDNISRLQTVPAPVSAFEITATSEHCKDLAFDAVLKGGVKHEAVSHSVISEAPDPTFKPNVTSEPNTVCTSITTTESVAALETFAALEKDDKEFPSVPFFEEIIKIKSDNVLELSDECDTIHESSISSTSDVASKSIPASEPIPVITTTSVSELDVERASISHSSIRTEFGSITVNEVAANPESAFEPRRLNISSTNHVFKTEQYNISDSDHRFHVLLDVSRYYSDSLSIHIIGDKIDVFGLEKSDDDFGDEYHEIHKIFVIPEYVDDSGLTACITESDRLLIYAPLKRNIDADIKNVKSTSL